MMTDPTISKIESKIKALESSRDYLTKGAWVLLGEVKDSDETLTHIHAAVVKLNSSIRGLELLKKMMAEGSK
jgi:hypothetical protein